MCGIVGYVGEAALDDCRDLQALAGELSGHRDVLFIGRGSNHPIALEAGVEAEGDLVPIAVATTGDDTTTWQVSHVLRVPAAPPLLQPFLTVLPSRCSATPLRWRKETTWTNRGTSPRA